MKLFFFWFLSIVGTFKTKSMSIYAFITGVEDSHINIAETQMLVGDNFITSPYFCIRRERVTFHYI